MRNLTGLVSGFVLVMAGACGGVDVTDDAGIDTPAAVDASPDGSSTIDAPTAIDAAIDAAGNPCDPNSDGLDETASCFAGRTYLRFLNATTVDTYDVFANAGSNPVVRQLTPHQVASVGPVDVGLHAIILRGAANISGEANTMDMSRWSFVGYRSATGALAIAAGAQESPAGCGTDSAPVSFGQFTTLSPEPVVILYTTNGGSTWAAPVSPGLQRGQIFGNGCWSSSLSIQFGVGPAGATVPTKRFAPMTFTGGISYQVMFTDTEIIRIDSLDRVTRHPSA